MPFFEAVMPLNLVTVSFQLAWRHIGQAAAPLLAGDDARLAGDRVSLADVGAHLVRSFRIPD